MIISGTILLMKTLCFAVLMNDLRSQNKEVSILKHSIERF